MRFKRSFRLATRIACCAIVWSAALSGPAQSAATWPERPVRVITPAAPGGTTDFLARLFSTKLSETLKEQFIVDNRASQSGVLAAELTMNAAPDGYTLFVPYHQHTINAALLPKLPYHPVNDFTPVTQLTAAGLMLVVHPDTPVKTLKDFIAWSKQQGGNLNFGSAGIGSGGHLAGELYKLMTGVQATHIPYKGTGPATTALLGKEYQFNFMGLSAATKLVSSGRLRGLAVTSTQRLKSMPDIPTVAESGIPGFEVVGWYGIMAPAKLPKPLLDRIYGEVMKALDDPGIQKAIFAQGATAVGSSPADFRKYLLADMEKWQKVVKASGAKPF
ncbi:MAG TPA: tripartite tricarboxylate transporter substrate binding protein [Burkholderiales bacterium]|nr:tripartite tricarboxylate transporter substrate binding protein [Burkholderiales bacterium]